MKQIDISTPKYPNTFTLVDDIDYEWLNKFKWHSKKSGNTFYAVRNILLPDGKYRRIWMHREILGLELGDKRQGDHKNHNGFDNWRDNLRTCNGTQNQQNKSPRRNCTSAFKGVSWRKDNRKWRARIQINDHYILLGLFTSEVIAAEAYDTAAVKHFGEFAYLNF